MSSVNILWLRRDLRRHDHAALNAILGQPSPVQSVFVFDTEILRRFSNKNDRRLSSIANALCQMHAELKKCGSGLLVLHGNAREIIPQLAHVLESNCIAAAEDYEPATRARDKHVETAIAPCKLLLVKDHVILSPLEVLRDKNPYKVFTPYSNAWHGTFSPDKEMQYSCNDAGRYADSKAIQTKVQSAGLKVIEPLDAAAMLSAVGYHYIPDSEWNADSASARLDHFITEKITAYSTGRDMLAEEGTSKLSPYLRFGLISIRECYQKARAARGAEKWISELIWREFYAMILYHYPESVNQEWNPAYRNHIAWSDNKTHFDAWREGHTGYPVVDAAMRQLLTTGWMHNRARMIVASFLTKHLLIDWRWGEEHFAQYLMDYELASNVGGWQWAASTGTDAQPYFRVFNPYTQSEKFDPEGEYIRRYVPELRHIKGKDIHNPPPLMAGPYPPPIVEHKKARERAIAAFKRV